MIVDDERNSREALCGFLQAGYNVTVAEDGLRAINILKKRDFDVVLTDLRMPGVDGMAVLKETCVKVPPVKCIILTAYGSVDAAVSAVKLGAFDFLEKPLNLDRVELVVKRALEARDLTEENLELKKQLNKNFSVEKIIGGSLAIHNVIETIKQVATSKATVLITGESGTGKELVAQALHSLGGRAGRFVAVHCAALSPTLLESELFGHEKGSFTGAAERRKGRFEIADGGTLFLDEIGEIDPSVQVKILRALETRSFERVGGTEPVTTDTRVVAATNKDLGRLVSEGRFREDLFYRLYVITINMPSLRERKEDIPLLVKHFIDYFSRDNSKKIDGITDDALGALMEYGWPGNVRELRNSIERMVVLSRKNILDINSIPVGLKHSPAARSSGEKGIVPQTTNIHDAERLLISKALSDSGGNISSAARELGISRRTLHRKLKK